MRLAELADVPRIVDLGAMMHVESNYKPIPFSHERVRTLARYMVEAPECFLAVWDRHGTVHGFMAGVSSPAWFGDGMARIATDLALYVEPCARHSAAAVMLARAFKQWAERRGAVQIRVGTAAGDAGQAANAVYEYLGFKHTGHCFVLDVEPQAVEQRAAA